MLVGNIRVVDQDPHIQTLCPPGDLAADSAEPDQTQRLTRELGADVLAARPLATLQGCIGRCYPAGEREHQRQRVLGSRDGVAARCVDDDDAARGRRGHVDRVDAGAGAADHSQSRCRIKQRFGHVGFAAHQQRFRLCEIAFEGCSIS